VLKHIKNPCKGDPHPRKKHNAEQQTGRLHVGLIVNQFNRIWNHITIVITNQKKMNMVRGDSIIQYWQTIWFVIIFEIDSFVTSLVEVVGQLIRVCNIESFIRQSL